MGAERTSRLRRCPSARPGVASARATQGEGDHPPLVGREARAGLHKRVPEHSKIGKDEKARKTGETDQVGAVIGRRFTLARARGGAP
jgi:hypothetical protein